MVKARKCTLSYTEATVRQIAFNSQLSYLRVLEGLIE